MTELKLTRRAMAVVTEAYAPSVELSRFFEECIFESAVLRRAILEFDEVSDPAATGTHRMSCSVHAGDEAWKLDSDEEFLAAYQRGFWQVDYSRSVKGLSLSVHAQQGSRLLLGQVMPTRTVVDVSHESRAVIEQIMNVFADNMDRARVPDPPPVTAPTPPAPVIFIGHGHSASWRELKDHLHEQHGFGVQAYETGARAGHVIRDILVNLARTSSFAVLVMTAEDRQADGTFRARENVVHEVGLFQGTLGFDRVIVAIEEGVEPFSNLQGIEQLRFSGGNIREIFGDVLATLRREFPSI